MNISCGFLLRISCLLHFINLIIILCTNFYYNFSCIGFLPVKSNNYLSFMWIPCSPLLGCFAYQNTLSDHTKHQFMTPEKADQCVFHVQDTDIGTHIKVVKNTNHFEIFPYLTSSLCILWSHVWQLESLKVYTWISVVYHIQLGPCQDELSLWVTNHMLR